MVKAENPIINAIGDWVIKSIDLSGYIFGGLHKDVRLKRIQMEARRVLVSEAERREIGERMAKSPITIDSTPVASLEPSAAPYYVRIEYNPEAEKAKTGCINDNCPAYFRYAGQACLGCKRKLDRENYWFPPLGESTHNN